MKKLPLGTQSFREIIEDGYVYVDKTDLLYELIKRKAVFLSRPRRFGKSLLLSTLENLFSGHKTLFQGLKIYNEMDEFIDHPVIKLSMTMKSYNPDFIEKSLLFRLNRIAKREAIKLTATSSDDALGELIEELYNKFKHKVVILIDEYDDPVSSNIDELSLAKENSKLLRYFYSALKDYNDYLHFVFVTGVTRYAMMGLSAGLNHLTDISLDPKYSSICGFTPEDLDIYFSDRYPFVLKTLKTIGYFPVSANENELRQEIFNWYDGYSWDGQTRVLNPISILKFFSGQKFDKYWRHTSPSVNFLTNIIEKAPLSFTEDKLENVLVDDIVLSEVGKLKPVPLLFQTGYLTINNLYYHDNNLFYSFKVPNIELKDAYYNILNQSLSKILVKDPVQESKNLYNAIINRDEVSLANIIAALYEGLQAEHHKNQQISESFYHSLLWAYCSGLVTEARAEEPGSGGYLDLILVLKDDTNVVIELKHEKSKGQKNIKLVLKRLANAALKSLKGKRYGKRYRLKGKKFVGVGVGIFDRGQVKVLFSENN